MSSPAAPLASALLRLRFVGAVLLLAVTAAAVGAQPSGQARGTLVIAGGALRPETAEVWTRIVALAGGRGAAIAVFGSASEDPRGSAGDTIATLARYGARAYFVPVATRLAGSDYRRAAADPRNVALVTRARGVYFTGGDQGRITQALVDAAGHRTPVLDAIWQVYRRGGVIAGSSAGAAIMSTTMFHEPAGIFDLLTDGVRPGSDIAAGLGFIGPRLFVDQHVLARGRFARMLPAMLASGYRFGLGIDENTAAVVKGDGQVEIVGRSGAVLLDLGAVAPGATTRPLRLAGARVSLLGPGDVYDPSSQRVTPAARRRAVDPAQAASATPSAATRDILGRDALVDVLVALVAGSAQDVHGVASDPGASRRPGFTFRFSRSDATRAFHADEAALHGYTILDVGLDVVGAEGPAATR